MSNGYELCLDEGILGIDGCVQMILDYIKIRKQWLLFTANRSRT